MSASTSDSPHGTHVRGHRLRFARAGWAACALLALVILIASVVPRYRQLATVTLGATVFTGQLRPFEAEALAQLGLSVSFYAAYFTLLEGLGSVAFFVIGAVIFWRRSDEWTPLLLSLALVSFGLIGSPMTTPLEGVHPALTALLVGLRAMGLVSFFVAFLLFPDGRFVPAWTKWLAVVWVSYITLSLAIPSLRLRSSLVWEDASQAIVVAWALSWMVMIAAFQVYRYRVHSTPLQRQQTKWVVFGLAVGLGLTVGASAPQLLVPLWALPLTTVFAARIAAFTVVLLTAIFMAVTIAVAILRSRLWDIDLLIRRTLVYSALSGLLALIYFGGVVGLQSLFRAVTGQEQSEFVTVISTLAIAALFAPLRRRVQDVIDRRFYRKKYDAAKTLAAFAATVRDETDLDRLTASLIAVVQETMQPEHVSLWLKPSPPSPLSRLERSGEGGGVARSAGVGGEAASGQEQKMNYTSRTSS